MWCGMALTETGEAKSIWSQVWIRALKEWGWNTLISSIIIAWIRRHRLRRPWRHWHRSSAAEKHSMQAFPIMTESIWSRQKQFWKTCTARISSTRTVIPSLTVRSRRTDWNRQQQKQRKGSSHSALWHRELWQTVTWTVSRLTAVLQRTEDF